MCAAVVQTSAGVYGVDESLLDCSADCLASAAVVQRKLRTRGGNDSCASPDETRRLLRTLFLWYDTSCYTEPSSLYADHLLVPDADGAVCWSAVFQSQVLTGPSGALSSLVPTAALFGKQGTPPLSSSTLAKLANTTDTTVARGMELALAATRGGAASSRSVARYNASLSCDWLIVPADPEARFVRLTLLFLSTEAIYDQLQTFAADFQQNTLSGPQPLADVRLTAPNGTVLSGQVPGSGITIDTSSGGLLVSFSSDTNIEDLGFMAVYSTSTEPFLDAPTCPSAHRLVTLFFTGLSGIQQASWAVVSDEPAACPNAGPSIARLGMSASGQGQESAILHGTGGPPPQHTDPGTAGAMVAWAFPATAPTMQPYEQATAVLCLSPGR
jgi:hypothetical protein